MKINAMARENFWALANKAKTQGRDFAEVLDREGYLLTPARRSEIRAQVLEEFAESLKEIPASTVARHQNYQSLLNTIISVAQKLAEMERKRS